MALVRRPDCDPEVSDQAAEPPGVIATARTITRYNPLAMYLRPGRRRAARGKVSQPMAELAVLRDGLAGRFLRQDRGIRYGWATVTTPDRCP